MTDQIFYSGNNFAKSYRRTETDFTLFDRPNFSPACKGDIIAMQFDTFLIVDNKPVFYLRWRADAINSATGWSEPKYKDFKVISINELPQFLKEKTLHGGYRLKDEKDSKSGLIPIEVPNPIITK